MSAPASSDRTDPPGERPFYLAPGLHTEIYDAHHEPDEEPLAGDIEFYVACARESGGPVLDLGCGTGRVSLPLARAGLEVVGLDLSPAMLAVARGRAAKEPGEVASRLTFVQGDMADFALGRTFPTVVIPFRSFQMLLTPEAERACLLAVRRHLAPGGRLVIDLFDPLLDLIAVEASGGHDIDWEGQHPETGNDVTVEVFERRNDRVNQTFEMRWRFTESAPDGSVIRQEDEVLRLRWLMRQEMHYLLELCGYEILAEYSDFFGSPPAYGKEQLYVVGAAGSLKGEAGSKGQ